jgi:hypothetical protein
MTACYFRRESYLDGLNSELHPPKFEAVLRIVKLARLKDYQRFEQSSGCWA